MSFLEFLFGISLFKSVVYHQGLSKSLQKDCVANIEPYKASSSIFSFNYV